MKNLSVLDPLDEAVVRLNGVEVVDSNRRGKEFGFIPGKEIFEVFTCDDIDEITKHLVENKDFIIITKATFFLMNSKRDVKLIYKNSDNFLFVQDQTSLNRLKEAKKDFVISISHEIFNPLTVLKGNILRLKDPEFLNDLDNIVASMERAVLKMERIVKQLKLLSMVELGLYSPKISYADPKKVVEEVLIDLKDKMDSKNIKVNFVCEVDYLETDSFAFYTIVRNLVSNAIKYSYPDSEVKININEKELVVEDKGIGIKEEEMERIFERFYRGKEATKMADGSGLGLAVVKHLCKLLGYDICVESTWLVGSRFKVIFTK